MNIKKSILLRVRAVFLLVMVFAIAIGYRIFHIQYVDGAEWRSKSSSFKIRPVKATRGNIYADDGSLLATSLPFYRLGFDPTVAVDSVWSRGIDSLALMLAKKFDSYPASYYKHTLKDARADHKRFMYLSRGYSLTYQDKQEMMKWPIFRNGKGKGGVIFEKIYHRFHPFKELGFRTVGFMNEDNFGVGLEMSFNPILAGVSGRATYQRMAGGIERPIFDGTEIRPVDGQDVYSTLNVNIQDVAESSLLRALTENNAEFGCVVVMEVETGEVKAMANLGRQGTGYSEKYNYAVGHQTYPGSTFKLASYMALLEDGKVRISDSINTGNGTFRVGDQTIKEAKDHAYGLISIKNAFAKSSNVAISKLVHKHYRHKPEKFLEHITNFGMAEPTSFHIRGEERPFFRLPSDKHWNDAALAKMSYGYEMRLTPLQMLTFYNGVANGGKVIQPIIAKEIRSNDKIIKQFEAKVIREKICSDETLEAVREMMIETVESGTAKKIRTENYKIAGKTGTAEKYENGHWIRNSFYTSFAGFFPADKPKYSAIVIIDSPKSGLMAGDAAAPVFKDIAVKIYANDVEMHKLLASKESAPDVPHIGSGQYEDLHRVCNKLNVSNYDRDTAKGEGWVSTSHTNKAIYWKANRPKDGKVPNVQGMCLKDAIYLIENFGYRVQTVGRGKVKNQIPAANAALERGRTIHVILG